MWRWAAYYEAYCNLSRGRYDDAESLLLAARRRAPSSEPALEGKLIWGLGVSALRRGNYDAAARNYAMARPYFVLAREAQNAGATSYLKSEALAFAGRREASAKEALDALRTLAPFEHTMHLSNHLVNVATLARSLELPYAAFSIITEVTETARATGQPHVIAWAYLNRARLQFAAPDPHAAVRV